MKRTLTIIILLCAAIFAGILIWDVYCAEAAGARPEYPASAPGEKTAAGRTKYTRTMAYLKIYDTLTAVRRAAAGRFEGGPAVFSFP
ncbi:hypothetical protein Cloev_0289 [Cloacibacillus evryensis DSM 19522]|nr:hypothetical protein Cloev_0289 [Cloacibacillus evryensis DSM 19522]